MTKPQVFMCHSSSDKEFVRRLATDLEAQGVDTWLDERQIRVGDSIQDKISAGIKDASWLIVVLSQKSVESPWVKKELNAAFLRELSEKRVVVLPALLERCEIPILLQDKRHADFSSAYEEGLANLLTAIFPDRQRNGLTLARFLLPAVAADMPVTEAGLAAIHDTIHGLENHLGLGTTSFLRARAGDVLTARHMNQIYKAITALRSHIGLSTRWDYFPVASGGFATANMFNELLGKANQIIRALVREQLGPNA